MGARCRAHCHRRDDVRPQDVVRALAHRHRRRTLTLLQRHEGLTVPELATRILAADRDRSHPRVAPVRSYLEVSPIARQRLRRRLEAEHLPPLTAAGLVRRTDAVVHLADHPALRDPTIQTILEHDEDCDALLSCLETPRRRLVLGTLSDRETPIDRLTLANAVLERAAGDASAADVKPALQELHHTHLPALEAAGVVTYDVDAKTVTYHGHECLEGSWLWRLTQPRTPDVRVLDGRHAVRRRARDLIASAEEELFVEIALAESPPLVPLDTIQNAAERDVEVVVCSAASAARQRVRAAVPAATVIEASAVRGSGAHETAGCLVLADRDAALTTTGPGPTTSGLTIATQATPSDTPTGFSGTGRNTPLVMTLRAQVDSRMDRSDAPRAVRPEPTP